MSNNSTWPSPDQQVAGQGRQDVHGTYLLDPNTQKATAPGAGTQYKDGDATPANPVGTMPVFDNGGTISRVSVANPLPVSATLTPAVNQRVSAHAGDFVDGADATQGLIADASVTGDNAGTVSAKLRGLSKIFADMWDSTNHWLQVKVMNGNANGQATMVNSAPVVPPSNWFGPVQLADGTTTTQKLAIDSSGRLTLVPSQTFELVDSGGTNKASIDGSGNLSVKVGPALPAGTNLIGYIGRSAVAAYSLASTATTSSSNSGDITVGPYTEISIDINTTAQTGTNPTIQFFYKRKGADGLYYSLWQSAVLSAAANTISTSIGAGMAYNQSLGATGQLTWVIGGTATPGYTFSANIQGK